MTPILKTVSTRYLHIWPDRRGMAILSGGGTLLGYMSSNTAAEQKKEQKKRKRKKQRQSNDGIDDATDGLPNSSIDNGGVDDNSKIVVVRLEKTKLPPATVPQADQCRHPGGRKNYPADVRVCRGGRSSPCRECRPRLAGRPHHRSRSSGSANVG